MKIESERLPNYPVMAPDSLKAMMVLAASFPSGGPDGRLMELVRLHDERERAALAWTEAPSLASVHPG